MKQSALRDWWQKNGPDLAVLACIALFFALFFARVFAGRRFILTGDAFFYTYPLRTVAWDMIRSGELPLWTPLFLSGYPLLSVALLALGYPLTWGHLFLPNHIAEQVYALAPFLLSPVTTYAYARTIGRSPLASLFAGLSFGYGGMMCGILANSGMLTNGLVWAPLALIFIERARMRSFSYCLFGTAAAYSLSVLAGHGQSYVYVGTLLFAYGGFTSISILLDRNTTKRSWTDRWTTWRPLVVALSAIILAAGVAAFQLLETWQAVGRSVRSALTYEVFSEGSFALREALLSLGAQIYHYVDSSTYVTPLALAFAATAVLSASLGRVRDPRIWFWLAVAVTSGLLLLGSNTPLNRLVYHVPIVNKFRVPSRHTFEWTLAISILGAFGWDAIAAWLRREHSSVAHDLNLFSAGVLFLATSTIGVLWWRAIVQWPTPNATIHTGLPERSYWIWKVVFTIFIAALAWCSFKVNACRPRAVLLVGTIMLACFVEANATASCWWAGFVSLPAARFHVVSDTTRYLQQFSPAENRVYTRVGMFSEEFRAQPLLEAPNLTMLWGLQDVAGMEPLILERYSRALGNVGPDAVTPRAGFHANDDLFAERSHVLDLLNATHVVTYVGPLKLYEDALVTHDGIGLSVGELSVTLAPTETVVFKANGDSADQLGLVTSLSNSVTEPNEAAIAKVTFVTQDGRAIEQILRAGTDTAEWAHERADVRTAIKHKLAPVFDNRPGDANNSFRAYRYWSLVKLDAPERIGHIKISNVSRSASLSVSKASLFNSTDRHSSALVPDSRASFWTTSYENVSVEVLHNARALPRAWLATEAVSVDGEEALSRIRGESAHEFNPRTTALLEVLPAELPQLAGHGASTPNTARITDYKPTRLTIETKAQIPTILVVSEIFYPGWRATIDGQVAPILVTDYLLRGIPLTAGEHKVEMVYTAPAARTGAIISVCSLLLLAVLFGHMRWLHSRSSGYSHGVKKLIVSTKGRGR